jgi:D-alanyl-D-alanine carboxypeptidase
VAYAAQFPPLFEAGEAGAWDYSNTNYVVLGMLVEQATGRTLAQELRARVIEPLELEATYVLPEERVAGPQARGYSKGTDQTEVAMSFTYGAANIVTTVGDLQTFGGALLSAELLEPETMALMEQFVDGKGQYDMPELEYGLGLMRSRLALGDGLPAEAGRVVGHIGGFGGFRAALWYAPASGALVTLGMNQAAIDPNELAAQALDAVLRADQP